MANSLYQQLNRNSAGASGINQGALQQIRQMKQAMRMMKNPQAALAAMAQQNPQVAQVMQAMQASGMNPKDFFMAKAKEAGVDPNQIISALQQI